MFYIWLILDDKIERKYRKKNLNWPAGQMLLAEAFNLAREDQNFVYSTCFFSKIAISMSRNNLNFVPLTCKKIGPPRDLSWTPLI